MHNRSSESIYLCIFSRVATVLSRAAGEWKYKVSEMSPYFTMTTTRSTERLPSVEYFNQFNHFNDGSDDYGGN